MFYRARWHDPVQGRFLSEDPIGVSAGLNMYAYVWNYPTGLADPSGLQGGAVGGAGVVTTGVVVVGGLALGWGIGRGIGNIPIGGDD
jgi:uncharacterized protein RhaS with RHS repeats